MGQPPQTCLNATDENGNIPIGLTDEVAVYYGGIVRPLSHHTAGGESIGLAFVLGDGIVIHHRIHIAAGHQKAQPWLAQNRNGLGIFPIRLGDNAHGISGIFQHPADNGVTKRRMIHIGVPDHIYKVALIPSPCGHIFFGNR